MIVTGTVAVDERQIMVVFSVQMLLHEEVVTVDADMEEVDTTEVSDDTVEVVELAVVVSAVV